ncbi:MAG: VIT domain-containing protein [Planctomycetota bacterium]|nr:VIT domain-containing protein [Planctomycetota bacterium]
MKTANKNVRHSAGHSRPSGSSSVLAIVTSCACLLAALGLFQVTGVENAPPGSGTELASDDASSESLVAAVASEETRRFAYPSRLVPQRREAAPVERVQVGDVITTGERERKRLTLPDGSVLFVNQQTVAKIETPRKVRVESGEVYVEVVPENLLAGELRTKFVVEAPDRSVTALGTKFAVKAAPKRETEVLVTQGEVAASGLGVSIESGRELVMLADAFASTEAELQPAGLVVQQAPRASEGLSWTRELMAARIVPVVPASKHRGGSLIVVDTEGQEMRLSLRKFHIDVHIEDGFARTTIDQTYFNHTQSRQEGTFHFPLPADASLSRLAMYVNGKLMEGGMAERDHARNTFEEIVRSMKDPALLEWVDGSTFKMRVFPLEPRQEKRIVMSYTQRLSNDYGKETYRFPAGHNLDRVRDWSTQVRVAGGANLEWDSPSHFLKAKKPDGDLVLEGEAQRVTMNDDLVVELTNPEQRRAKTSTKFSSAEHEGQQYLMVRFRPDLNESRTDAHVRPSQKDAQSSQTDVGVRPTKSKTRRPLRNWVFLYESSGDRDPVLARVQVDLIRTFLENAEHDDTFSIVRASSKAERFSVRPVPCVKKEIEKAVDFMEDSHLLGALDLGQAFKLCSKQTSDDSENWLVHVGSGIPAIGERDASALERRLPKNARYVGVGIGKRWNRPFMKAAAGRTGGHFAQINPDEKIGWRAFELFSTLNAPRLLDVQVVALRENKDDADPRFLNFADTLAHGQELCAVTRLSSEDDLPESVVVTGLLNGKPFQQTVKVKKVVKNADYLPRSWSRLEIDRLVALGATEHKDTIISLSKAMYVMSPFTSLLVLENEEMYKQYNIDRGRKDHWALYGAPAEIQVVHEPLMGPRPNASPAELTRLLQEALAVHDEAQANLSLAERDQRNGRIIEDLERQLELRQAEVEQLSAQVRQQEVVEKDDLKKLAGTVVWKQPQVAGKQLVWIGDSGLQEHWINGTRRPGLQPNNWFRPSDRLADRIAAYELAYRMQPGYIVAGTDDGLDGLVDDYLLAGADGRDILPQQQAWGLIQDGSVRWLDQQTLTLYGATSTSSVLARPSITQLQSDEWIDPARSYAPYGAYRNSNDFFLSTFGRPSRGTRTSGVDFDGDGYIPDYGLWNGPVVVSSAGTPIRPLLKELDVVDERFRGAVFTMPLPYRVSGNWGFPGSQGLTSHSQIKAVLTTQQQAQLTAAMPDLIRELNREVEVESLDDLGVVILRGNPSDVLDVKLTIEQIERTAAADIDPIRVVQLRSTDPTIALKTVLERREFGIDLPALVAADAWGVDRLARPMFFERQLNQRLLGYSYNGSQQVILKPPGMLPDLIELMPGLQTLPADTLAVLAAEGGEKTKARRGSVDEKARELIERARRSGWQRVVVKSLSGNDEPVTVSVSGAGRFRFDRTLPSGLKETVICDGETLWHVYAELGLASKRPMSRFHREAMNSLFPWAVHPTEDLSVGCDVRYVDENTIELVPLKPLKSDSKSGGKDAVSEGETKAKSRTKVVIVRLVFGEDGRLAEKQLVVGKKRDLVLRTVFAKDGQVRILNSADKEIATWKIDRTDSEPVNLTPETDGLVVLPLPYRSAEHVQPLLTQKDAFTAIAEDDALKVVASYFATGNYAALANLIQERYINRNDNRLGFLTMISVWATHNVAVQPIFNSRKDPMQQFLCEYYDWRNFRNPNIEFTQSDKLPPFIQEFVRSHNLFTLWYSGRATQDRTKAQVGTELNRTLAAIRECPHEDFRWKLLEVVQQKIHEAKMMEGEFGRSLADELKPFEKSPVYAGSAPYARIIWLLRAQETKGVGKMYRDLLVDVAEQGGVIILSDEIHKLFKQRLKGHREWTSAVNAVAKVLRKNRGPVSLMDLAEQCRSLEEAELANSLYLDALKELKPVEDPRRLQLIYGFVRRASDWKRADEYLRVLLKDENFAKQPALWREASAVSSELSQHDESLRRLEHALNLEFQDLPEAVDLQPFRASYGQLFDQFAALAENASSEEKTLPKDFLNRLLAMADRWRTIDPNDTDVCQRVARIASKLNEVDLAWGYLTTPLAENPGDSTAWRNLANEMGAQSNTKLASRAFDQAFEIESTNPEILYEHAMMLRAAGDEVAAKKKLSEIVNGTWGRKFNGVKSNADRALQQTP